MLLVALALGWEVLPVRAQTQVTFQPAPMYDDGNYPSSPNPTYSSTLAGAWALTQAAVDTCSPGGGCVNGRYATNLHPDETGPLAIIENGQWYLHDFDMVNCDTPQGGSTQCSTSSNWGSLQVTWLCPSNAGGGTTKIGSNPTTYQIYCTEDIPGETPPEPAKNCPCSKVGEPIDAANGEET